MTMWGASGGERRREAGSRCDGAELRRWRRRMSEVHKARQRNRSAIPIVLVRPPCESRDDETKHDQLEDLMPLFVAAIIAANRHGRTAQTAVPVNAPPLWVMCIDEASLALRTLCSRLRRWSTGQ